MAVDYVHHPIQYQSKTDQNTYNFGYDTGLLGAHSFHHEHRDDNGIVRGRYGYTGPEGKLKVVEYEAGPAGYRVTGGYNPNEPQSNTIDGDLLDVENTSKDFDQVSVDPEAHTSLPMTTESLLEAKTIMTKFELVSENSNDKLNDTVTAPNTGVEQRLEDEKNRLQTLDNTNSTADSGEDSNPELVTKTVSTNLFDRLPPILSSRFYITHLTLRAYNQLVRRRWPFYIHLPQTWAFGAPNYYAR
ncbi:uncharacterized protein LOC111087096 [Limulus polyphemus]|uniref:Uncharacterized protein LOC111087096 n=1 Tax=Limulus polyphemus TaxID=6850 RepID=A0ABM1SX63_LIMPO|nr:uncharacterized protein LOC111087096 [Limulus polyphemus]